MPNATIKYRCRLCAETFGNGTSTVENVRTILICLMAGTRAPLIGANLVCMTEVHECANGNIGVGDLIGAEVAAG